MQEQSIRAGVIGVGHLGSIHARLWPQIAGANLVGLYDLDADRARQVAEEQGTRRFDDLSELLASVDAVSIVTPTSSHAAVARQALEAGVHCFIEKPITARHAEAMPLIELAAAHRRTLQVGHVERFNPAMLALREHALAPKFIESHRLAQFKPRATDVAVVLDLMIHDIDLALSLVASDVVEIRASGVSVISDTIDIANARLEFANGCVANLTASRISQRAMRKMRLFQQDSYISIDFNAPSVEIFRIGEEGSQSGPSTILLGAIDQGSSRRTITYEQLAPPPVNAIVQELESFVGAIRGGSQPLVTAGAAAEALRIAEQIVEAIEQRREAPVR